MSNKVWIVTGIDLGWDCIVGVFSEDDISFDELQQVFPEDSGCIIHGPRSVEKSTTLYK